MASEVADADTRAGDESDGDSSVGSQRSRRRSVGGSLHWWTELIIVLAFYGVYTFIRNQFGSDLGQSVKQTAIDNAYDVIAWERAVHLFGEKGIQDLFIEWDLFIQFWNIFYGFCHFAVTISVMVFLFWRHPVRYGIQRTVLAFTTALALVGFAFYPLMPPRLLNDCSPFGACDPQLLLRGHPRRPGRVLVVQLERHDGHLPTSTRPCPACTSPGRCGAWWRPCRFCAAAGCAWLCLAYPWLTLFAVMVTANHYWIDAVGGLLAVAIAYPAGVLLARRLPAWLAPRPAGAVRP